MCIGTQELSAWIFPQIIIANDSIQIIQKIKNGEITSLFINKKERLIQNIWYEAKSYPTKGFKVRPFFHCVGKPIAPHLSQKDRVWLKVEIQDYIELIRPKNQGGKWYLANKLKILNDEIL